MTHRLLWRKYYQCGASGAFWLYTQPSEPHWTDTLVQWVGVAYISTSGFAFARRRWMLGCSLLGAGVAHLYLAKNDVVVYHVEDWNWGVRPILILSRDRQITNSKSFRRE
jgi:hypothetical protein